MTLTSKKPLLFQTGILLFLSLLLLSNPLAGKEYIKCWKNTKGMLECGNRIPKEYYNQRIRYIDENGITRKIKEKAQTKEERNSQRRMAKLLNDEVKKQQKLDDYDAILLKTYLTIDDLLASLNSRLEIIKSRSSVLNATIELKQKQFDNLVKKAAALERSGSKKPDSLLNNLDAILKDISSLKTQVKEQKENTIKIKSVFSHDVERFILSKSKRLKKSLAHQKDAKKLPVTAINCANKAECDFHWGTANQFITENATTKVLYSTAKMTVTDIPTKPQDISITLSLLDNTSENEAGIQFKKTLLLQVRCHPKKEGKELCSGEKVAHIIKEFKRSMTQ